MSELLVKAELIKLARALGAKEQDVAFLAPLHVAGLRKLEDRVSSILFNEHQGAFRKLADASKLLPASLIAKMSELVFGPMLSARISGLMDPDRAIEIATKLKTRFLADVTVEMAPRSASALLKRMPTRIVVDVAQLLLQRQEYVTMGRFVDELSDEAIRKVADSIEDDEALVRIGFFVERPGRVGELIDLLGEERIRRIVATASTGSQEVQDAGLALMSRLGRKQQGRFGEAAIALGPKVLNALIGLGQREGAAEVVGSVIEAVGASGRAAFAKMLGEMDAATLTRWARATTQAGLWPAALRVLAASSAEIQQQAAAALGKLDKPERSEVGKAVKAAGLERELAILKATLNQ